MVNGTVVISDLKVISKQSTRFHATWSITCQAGLGFLPRRVYFLLSALKDGTKTPIYGASDLMKKGAVWSGIGWDGYSNLIPELPYSLVLEAGLCGPLPLGLYMRGIKLKQDEKTVDC